MGFGTVYRLIVPNLTRLSVARSSDGIQITWKAVPGVSYRISYKSNLSETSWSDLPGDVVATGTTASKTDGLSGGQRFYRVMVLRAL